MAKALGIELTPERCAIYIEALRDIGYEQNKFACAQALRTCKFFPAIAELREYAAQWQPAEDPKVQEILKRDDKPPDWIKMQQSDWAELGRKNGVTQEEITQWLEEGKQKQLAHIRKLEADPKWREQAERLGALPGLKVKLTPTEVPPDRDARRPWAHNKAVQQGWKEDSCPE